MLLGGSWVAAVRERDGAFCRVVLVMIVRCSTPVPDSGQTDGCGGWTSALSNGFQRRRTDVPCPAATSLRQATPVSGQS